MYHLVIGDSAGGCLRQLVPVETIIVFRDDLSFGPLQASLEERAAMWGRLIPEIDDISIIIDDLRYTEQQLTALDDEHVCLWIGNGVGEQTALRYFTYRLPNATLSLVHVDERGIGACSPERLATEFPAMRTLTSEERQQRTNDWHQLVATNTTLRIYENGRVISVNDDYYDEALLATTTTDWTAAARVIGETMGTHEQVVSDTILLSRVLSLVERGQLRANAPFKTMRQLHIKR